MLRTMRIGLVSAAPTKISQFVDGCRYVFQRHNSCQPAVVPGSDTLMTAGHVVAVDDAARHQAYIPSNFGGTFYPDEPVDEQTEIERFDIAKNGKRNGVTNGSG